jgi:assimilatory nitrate reductase catalytic subunit
VNQSASGTDKVNAIINCHLATGRIGRPGTGPFSVTGQPNAMGGREVGGLANTLAAHMELSDAGHRRRVQNFWRSPRIAEKPGLKAVDLFRAVGDGKVKALWIMATNPVVSMPEAGGVEEAIRNCPFVVVSDVVAETDTLRHAHVKLPATGWGEKDGTVTNSERRISRQRPFLPPPGEARADWWALAEVGKRMGFAEAFAYRGPPDIFAEHAALSAFENDGARDFDIGRYLAISAREFDRLAPFQWPHSSSAGSKRRLFADGKFFTKDGKARIVPVHLNAGTRSSADFPLTLNTGRIRDHWHTMTRSGRSQRLSQHLAEPYVEIHPEDAARYTIRDADLVRVSTGLGAVLVRALPSVRQRPGSIFVPMHWSDQFASKARVDALVPAVTDAVSGQPASKNVAARVERFVAARYGFAVLKRKPARIDAEYWALAKCNGGWRMELAFAADRSDWSETARALFQVSESAEMIAYCDECANLHRFACYESDRLAGALFLGPGPVAVSRDWAVQQLTATHADRRARFAIIAGRPGNGVADKGAIVCSCFAVGSNEIAAAIARGCSSVAAVGEAIQAGTNCGSCRAEIRNILDMQSRQAAE